MTDKTTQPIERAVPGRQGLEALQKQVCGRFGNASLLELPTHTLRANLVQLVNRGECCDLELARHTTHLNQRPQDPPVVASNKAAFFHIFSCLKKPLCESRTARVA